MINGHADGSCRSEEVIVDATASEMGTKDNIEERDSHLSDIEKDVKQENGESDYEPARGSLSSQSNEDNIKRASPVPKKLSRKESVENGTHASSGSSNKQASKMQYKASNSGQRRSQKPSRGSSTPKVLGVKKSDHMKVPPKPPSELSEESDDKAVEVKEMDVLDEAFVCDRSAGTDDDIADTEENNVEDDSASAFQKIKDMEQKIEKLEEELRAVAALEISLYSVVPEHGSSAHKVHTPARRLSRLYIYACKHWTQGKRAIIAKNTVSGLVLIAKSCGHDVSRLIFWLSNTVVLREIISQNFGNICHTNTNLSVVESNGSGKNVDSKSPQAKWKNGSVGKKKKMASILQEVGDWPETSTFMAALEKIESWIFSRAVESVWWQTLTPHMQSPVEDLYSPRGYGKVLGPALGDQMQGNFSINLWNSAFRDAFTRLCPLRSGGHECGCLPVLARMVMEQCVSRLDIAMFNAILRESANEMPTDPVSDPIVDPKVLPIPAGDLSFGSGAQLKNSIGNWSRCLTDLFGMDAEDCIKDNKANGEDEAGRDADSKSFPLLNELSDLLMLPKDMLLERTIRKEVCPSIGLPLITRILCNFTPDEFCPDPVPGIVLEELNAESLLERRQSEKDMICSFPCSAAPVVYLPPSAADVAEKVADASGKANLDRRASIIQRKGHTSDEDLDDLDSPLTSIINKHTTIGEGTQKDSKQRNARYKLLREVWSE